MLYKEKYISHIKDQETRLVIVKNLSALETVLKDYVIKNTDFLDPYQTYLYTSILNSFSDEVKYRVCGGLDTSERKIVQIFPFYSDEDEIKLPIAAIRIDLPSKKLKISHRDCLGALTNLGIVRDKIGDIYIQDNRVYVVLDSKIASYVVINLVKIKTYNVSLEIIPLNEIKKSETSYEYKTISISSNRLDNIIAATYNLSREQASKIILYNKIKVDFKPVDKASEKLEGKSLISVKGRGRFIYYGNELKTTRKGRLSTKVALYM